jgi:hypothetical protein
MAKWFDEPFQADMLTRFTSVAHSLTTQKQDRDYHADICYIDLSTNIQTFIDAKSVTRNFEYIDQSIGRTSYIDAIAIGQYALSSNVSYFSFVWRSGLYVVQHSSLHTVTPIRVKVSYGQNNHRQVLSHYSVQSLISIPETKHYIIPEPYMKVYDDAYACYERSRNMMFDMGRPEQTEFRSSVNYRTLVNFARELKPIIVRYNNIDSTPKYIELPHCDEFKQNLTNILSGIL